MYTAVYLNGQILGTGASASQALREANDANSVGDIRIDLPANVIKKDTPTFVILSKDAWVKVVKGDTEPSLVFIDDPSTRRGYYALDLFGFEGG